ncbi:unnamed protein product, partial [Iphiclides podalirius]
MGVDSERSWGAVLAFCEDIITQKEAAEREMSFKVCPFVSGNSRQKPTATDKIAAKTKQGTHCGLKVAMNGATIAPNLAPMDVAPKAMFRIGVGNSSDT